jgi:hypothetical protein
VEKISWTDCVRNEEVLHRVKEESNIPYTIERGLLHLAWEVSSKTRRLGKYSGEEKTRQRT